MKNIERYIDHTLLKPDATKEMIVRLCEEAKEYNFYSVCINLYYVNLCRKLLKGSDIKICTVIGFPLGASGLASKVCEARYAIENGAEEIDMVINLGALKSKEYNDVSNEILSVYKEVKSKALLKVIIETCLLNDDEKRKACRLAVDAGADFVKTSTGFSSGGATVKDIMLMKEAVNDRCKVKASGGIRCLEDFENMISAGADRIGASSSVNILKEFYEKYK